MKLDLVISLMLGGEGWGAEGEVNPGGVNTHMGLIAKAEVQSHSPL